MTNKYVLVNPLMIIQEWGKIIATNANDDSEAGDKIYKEMSKFFTTKVWYFYFTLYNKTNRTWINYKVLEKEWKDSKIDSVVYKIEILDSLPPQKFIKKMIKMLKKIINSSLKIKNPKIKGGKKKYDKKQMSKKSDTKSQKSENVKNNNNDVDKENYSKNKQMEKTYDNKKKVSNREFQNYNKNKNYDKKNYDNDWNSRRHRRKNNLFDDDDFSLSDDVYSWISSSEDELLYNDKLRYYLSGLNTYAYFTDIYGRVVNVMPGIITNKDWKIYMIHYLDPYAPIF